MRFCGHDVDIENSDERLSGGLLREDGRTRRFVEWPQLLPLLADPLTRAPLLLDEDRLHAQGRSYPIVDGSPQLFPCDLDRITRLLQGADVLTEFPSLSALEQYCAFGILKVSGNRNVTNLGHEDPWYGRHLWRSRRMLEEVRGSFLDIGCDDAFLSRGMLHPDVRYVGLEPTTSPSDAMRVGGLGEFLPFQDGSFDAAGFQTSLDHIFDYHLALSEARRVLRPGGRLYLATLLWTGEGAQLYTDTVHFHHFRPHQIEAALADGFEVVRVQAYSWKNDRHRFGVYLCAEKR